MTDTQPPATPEKKHRLYQTCKNLLYPILLIAILTTIGFVGWQYWSDRILSTSPVTEHTVTTQTPAAQTNESEQVAQHLIKVLRHEQHRLQLFSMQHYLVAAEQHLHAGRLDQAHTNLNRAAEYISSTETTAQIKQLKKLLSEDIQRLRTYENPQAHEAIQTITRLLAQATSETAATKPRSEPLPEPAFWEHPLAFIQTRIQAGWTMKPNMHTGNPVALHPKTLLVQALVLIRTAAVLRDQTFYHLAVENALTIHKTLNGNHDETHRVLQRLSELNIVGSPPPITALAHLGTLLGQMP